jgi:hypothetical protein
MDGELAQLELHPAPFLIRQAPLDHSTVSAAQPAADAVDIIAQALRILGRWKVMIGWRDRYATCCGSISSTETTWSG